MNDGISPPGGGIFLVKCADCKCLAVRGAGGQWRSFYEDAGLTGAVEIVTSVPIELILPFLPGAKRERMFLIPERAQN